MDLSRLASLVRDHGETVITIVILSAAFAFVARCVFDLASLARIGAP